MVIQVNLDMTDSMGPGKLVCHMQNPSYTYDKYLICMGLGPSILSVIDENPSYSGPSYPSSPIVCSQLPNQVLVILPGFAVWFHPLLSQFSLAACRKHPFPGHALVGTGPALRRTTSSSHSESKYIYYTTSPVQN